MKIKGKCDFCKIEGEWDGVECNSKDAARCRPKDLAAIIPWNCKKLPKGITFKPESIKKGGVITHIACPECFRN